MPRQWTPAFVRSEDERGSGGSSQYIRLGEQNPRFSGYALFDADPAGKETGYLEYQEHFDVAAKRSIPCAGEDCPLCEEGDRPKLRAKTLWLVTKDENGKDLGDGELRIFQANWNVIKVFTEMRAEGDKIKGRLFRVARVDDRGNYMFTPKDDKLTITQVKEQLKAEAAPDFEALITSTLQKAMQGYQTRRVLDDDDDDVEQPRQAPNKGRGRGRAPEPEDEGEFPAEAENLVVSVLSVDDENFIMVAREDAENEGELVDEEVKVWGTEDLDLTEFAEVDWIYLTYAIDDDDEYVATAAEVWVEDAEPEAEPEPEQEPEPSDDLPSSVEGVTFEVVGDVNEEDGFMPVKSEEEEMEFDLYVLEGVTIDWDDYSVGTKIVVNAEKDRQGDMLSAEAPEIVKPKPISRRGSSTGAARGSTKTKSAAKKTSSKATTKKTSSKSSSKAATKKTTSRRATR